MSKKTHRSYPFVLIGVLAIIIYGMVAKPPPSEIRNAQTRPRSGSVEVLKTSIGIMYYATQTEEAQRFLEVRTATPIPSVIMSKEYIEQLNIVQMLGYSASSDHNLWYDKKWVHKFLGEIEYLIGLSLGTQLEEQTKRLYVDFGRGVTLSSSESLSEAMKNIMIIKEIAKCQ